MGAPLRIVTLPRRRSVIESVARARPLTAVLMPAEPHIRSPFTERLAPQSLILEVIGLQRQVILLVGLEGTSYGQTAMILGVPIGTRTP
jgi:DNA-directed RNA polymerase specialized sigma24 family protein